MRKLVRRNAFPSLYNNSYSSALTDDMFSRMERIMRWLDLPETNVSGPILEKASYPKIDIIKKENGDTIIEASVPGLKKEEVSIKIIDDVLTISGEKRTDEEIKDDNFLYKELSRGYFSRSFNGVNEAVYDLDNMSAKLEDGILQIKLPGKEKEEEKEKERKITIE